MVSRHHVTILLRSFIHSTSIHFFLSHSLWWSQASSHPHTYSTNAYRRMLQNHSDLCSCSRKSLTVLLFAMRLFLSRFVIESRLLNLSISGCCQKNCANFMINVLKEEPLDPKKVGVFPLISWAFRLYNSRYTFSRWWQNERNSVVKYLKTWVYLLCSVYKDVNISRNSLI